MTSLDGGSAAPATPDVPARVRFRASVRDTPAWRDYLTDWLRDNEIAPERVPFNALITVDLRVIMVEVFDCSASDSRRTMTVPLKVPFVWPSETTDLDHSGVAGERSDSQKASESSQNPLPIHGHSPDPTKPAAAILAGGPRLPVELRGDGPCDDCGTADNIVWFTENVLWNAVMRYEGAPPEGFCCPTCFVRRVHECGFAPTGWRLLPDWHWETTAEYAARRAVRDGRRVIEDGDHHG